MPGESLLFTVLVNQILPSSQLSGTETQFLTDQRIGYARFSRPPKNLSFELCAVALSLCHETPPRTV